MGYQQTEDGKVTAVFTQENIQALHELLLAQRCIFFGFNTFQAVLDEVKYLPGEKREPTEEELKTLPWPDGVRLMNKPEVKIRVTFEVV